MQLRSLKLEILDQKGYFLKLEGDYCGSNTVATIFVPKENKGKLLGALSAMLLGSDPYSFIEDLEHEEICEKENSISIRSDSGSEKEFEMMLDADKQSYRERGDDDDRE